MKKLLPILLLIACSEDEPVFKIESGSGYKLESRFDKYVQKATDNGVTITKSNMILRYSQDDNTNTNDSRAYKKDGQLYIDIDEKFIMANCPQENQFEVVLFQQLSNGLLNKSFGNCGMMQKINTSQDITSKDFTNLNYVSLFKDC